MDTFIFHVVTAFMMVMVMDLRDLKSMVTGTKLTETILNYQPLHYDHHHLHQQHHRSKRAAQPDVNLHFAAFGRDFNITLRRDTDLFSQHIQIETTSGHVPYDISRAYNGNLREDYVGYGFKPTVNGLITTTGHFQGTIDTGEEFYVVEKAKKYFKEPQDFHSVIYRRSDVKFDVDSAFCGAEKHRERLFTIQQSATRKSNEGHNEDKGKTTYDWSKDNDTHSDWSEKYLHYDHKRQKRDIVPTKTTCELYMQADHVIFQQHGSDVDSLIEELSQSVQTVNAIYGAIDFDGDSSADNINFIIKKIKVHTNTSDPTYRLNGNYGVEKFLELHSQENYDSFCLSYMFTHRDFDGGVLGLAWTAGEGQSGGVCEKYTAFSQGRLSLNSGIVTTLNYGKTVSTLVSQLTFAHEIGHNFGSPHDTEGTSCAPGSTSGNYIMYARATSGLQPNNNAFSTCSIAKMAPILASKARSASGCFVEPMGSICGNKVVEGAEECDCGWEEDCTEGCCNPQTSAAGAPTPCTKTATSVCSPSSGPCCDSSCQYVTAAANHVCRSSTSCLAEASCDGTSANCPTSTWVANKTPCGENQVCVNGTCSGSVCLAFDYPPCQCTSTTAGNWKDERLCQICCEDGGQCKPSYEISGVPNGSTVPGSPCNDFQGYCDVFYRCREVDPTGTFSTIKKLLSSENLQSLKEWLIAHWYVPVLAGLGFIVLMVIFVKVCGKKVPSDKELYERRQRRYGNNAMQLSPRHKTNSVAPTGYM
ncbi:disintegrin and metalloproteinase domain-containing protein 10-like [Haliotis rufescens]|uniref:disintegrin and metalloproteinase domain-containing protein 10-like n=1 Tax=Haliotis rufescens TaxID=6454 RepID=UPI00201F51E5|nr:disintegrin and metalloproteinase domain-containing protein 10-like [Haliotis rufescens]